MYNNTSSKDLPKRAKKAALRLDGVQFAIGAQTYTCYKHNYGEWGTSLYGLNECDVLNSERSESPKGPINARRPVSGVS